MSYVLNRFFPHRVEFMDAGCQTPPAMVLPVVVPPSEAAEAEEEELLGVSSDVHMDTRMEVAQPSSLSTHGQAPQ